MIALPASNDAVLTVAIDPALAILPSHMTSPEVKVLLLAIGRTETNFAARLQKDGPARGLWQFERNGVLAVMHHPASAQYVHDSIIKCGIPYGSTAIYTALADDDVLAAVLARLLLWTDPLPLPPIGDIQAAWNYYTRNWRPGKPDPERWQTAYDDALVTIA